MYCIARTWSPKQIRKLTDLINHETIKVQKTGEEPQMMVRTYVMLRIMMIIIMMILMVLTMMIMMMLMMMMLMLMMMDGDHAMML